MTYTHDVLFVHTHMLFYYHTIHDMEEYSIYQMIVVGVIIGGAMGVGLLIRRMRAKMIKKLLTHLRKNILR